MLASASTREMCIFFASRCLPKNDYIHVMHSLDELRFSRYLLLADRYHGCKGDACTGRKPAKELSLHHRSPRRAVQHTRPGNTDARPTRPHFQMSSTHGVLQCMHQLAASQHARCSNSHLPKVQAEGIPEVTDYHTTQHNTPWRRLGSKLQVRSQCSP